MNRLGFLRLSIKRFSVSINKTPKFVSFEYEELKDKSLDLSSKIEAAYRLNGLGGSVVKNIPNFSKFKQKQIENTLKLSTEPEEVINKLRKPNVLDPIGWYDSPFYSKGNKGSSAYHSFFARYPKETIVYPEDPKLVEESTNVWPDTIPNFKEDFVKLNEVICETMVNMMYHFDKYFNKLIKDYDFNMTKDLADNYVNTSRTIIYKPLPKEDLDQNWDHWHTDYGIFTSVAKPIYYGKNLERLDINDTSFNFMDRQGNMHEANFTHDDMLITISDTMFILSAGLIPTTPHCVKANGVPRDIYRLNHVSFFEPQYNYQLKIPSGEDFSQIIEKDPLKFYYRSTNKFENGISYKSFNDLVLSLLINNEFK